MRRIGCLNSSVALEERKGKERKEKEEKKKKERKGRKRGREYFGEARFDDDI